MAGSQQLLFDLSPSYSVIRMRIRVRGILLLFCMSLGIVEA